MKRALRVWATLLPLAFAPALPAQLAPTRVIRIDVQHVGPASVSDDLIRANIRVKVGDPYLPLAVDDDVRTLYGTGFFYHVRVSPEFSREGVALTYTVQARPTLVDIKFRGNKEFSDARLHKKISSKKDEPLDERKLFTDCQEIQKLYQKSGFPQTEVKYALSIDENAGRGTATFEITETPKVKIVKVEFVGAKAFTAKQLRGGFLKSGVVKTRKRGFFSWITGSGYLKDDQLDEDKERLAEFYRDHGYIDFELKNVEFVHPTPKSLIVRFVLDEGTQYRIGAVTITGNTLFTTNDITRGLRAVRASRPGKVKIGPHGLGMDVGDVFTSKGLTADLEQISDFYGARGYIDVTPSSRHLTVTRIPNTDTGTMDLEFQVEEGQKFRIEKIEIRGNIKTKDRVIRRELAVSPGETFDMVKVKLSKLRLEGLRLFDSVETQSEPTDVRDARNLAITIDETEKRTGHVNVGAGFSSVDALVGFVEVSQENFDLFHPPTFTGGGQKARLHLAIGTEQQDYSLSFIEPWFLERKLVLGTDLYYRKMDYQSLNGLYDEVRAGAGVTLKRALGTEALIGTVGYTLEDVGILLNEAPILVPQSIREQAGYSLLSKGRAGLTYDTRGPGLLPNRGQRTEFMAQLVGGPLGGDQNYYRLDLTTAWYFKGLFPGHVLEIIGQTGVAQSFGGTPDVPFYDRFYLGGLFNLRGYRYRGVSPREPSAYDEPVGGDTFWFASAEYSIPIVTPENEARGLGIRFAIFYDVGSVQSGAYDWVPQYFDDDVGVGIRLNLPIGPLRLDYAFPITHDQYNSGGGRFQFGVGYTRQF